MDEWRQQRAAIVEAKEKALRSEAQREHAQATALLQRAAQAFHDAGISPYRLRALSYGGGPPVKTTLRGWYLKADYSIGMDVDANFYALHTDGGLLNRLHGAHIHPSMAPLVVGRSGRDGEQIALHELLELRLREPIAPVKKRDRS